MTKWKETQTRWNTQLRELMRTFDRKRGLEVYKEETPEPIVLDKSADHLRRSQQPQQRLPEVVGHVSHSAEPMSFKSLVLCLVLVAGLGYLVREGMRLRSERERLTNQVIEPQPAQVNANSQPVVPEPLPRVDGGPVYRDAAHAIAAAAIRKADEEAMARSLQSSPAPAPKSAARPAGARPVAVNPHTPARRPAAKAQPQPQQPARGGKSAGAMRKPLAPRQ